MLLATLIYELNRVNSKPQPKVLSTMRLRDGREGSAVAERELLREERDVARATKEIGTLSR